MNEHRRSVECSMEVFVFTAQSARQFLAITATNEEADRQGDGSVRSLLTVGEDRS